VWGLNVPVKLAPVPINVNPLLHIIVAVGPNAWVLAAGAQL